MVNRLRDALGNDAVRFGDEISPDYCVDETLGAHPVQPAALVLPSESAQVATVLRIASEEGWPVTARGAGTGLSGACIPAAGGIVISFERMRRILEIDRLRHVAVVEPGVTLAGLDEATAMVDLVYPVFPGTLTASLGGNIATNAGGMRAVKYGVTRHQVLGVEAVTGTGEIIRTGGRYVKNTTGYDLAQLIIGSEGTLALVTEATLRLHPRLAHSASLLVPFQTVDELAEVIPAIVSSGVQPMILEYIDRSTMRGLLRSNDLTLGVPAEITALTEAYLIVVLEGRRREQVDADVEVVVDQVNRAGALDVFVLPEGRGAQLLAARENAFWMVKAAGADDLIDMVVPRVLIPEYLRRVMAIADETGSKVYGCGHAGDGNIHFSVYEPDETRRSRLMQDIYAMGMSLGGAISGEHGIGRAKRSYYQKLEDPARIALQRRIKAAFDPAGILNPGVVFEA